MYKPEFKGPIVHYVYYLLDPVHGGIIYIGRSVDPEKRWKDFYRRTGVKTELGLYQRFTIFSRACEAELGAIMKHKPPYNQRLVSSAGHLGVPLRDETRQRISQALAGRPVSQEHRDQLSASMKGRVNHWITPEIQAKAALARMGKKRGPYKKRVAI